MPEELTRSESGSKDRLRVAIDEEERLAALGRYKILDTANDPFYDRLAEMLRDACQMDWAAVSFVDRHRQWFKSRDGLPVPETPRDVSFCSVAMHSSNPFVVEDATRDQRFINNDLVTGKNHLRSYFGMPIFSSEGFGLGSVCVVATEQPRPLQSCHMNLLAKARDWVQASLEARLITLEAPSMLADNPALERTLSQRRAYVTSRTAQTWKAVEDAYQLCFPADTD